MADIGLGRADRQRRAGPVPTDGLADRGGLDRVAGGGAGAMRLEIADAVGTDRRFGQHLFQQRLLRRLVGQEMPMVRPAAFTPLARMTPRMASPAASASSSGLSRTMPAPSART